MHRCGCFGCALTDRWGIDTPATILDDSLVSHEQDSQRSRVLSAVQRAYALTVAKAAPANTAYVSSGDNLLEPRNQDFGLDL